MREQKVYVCEICESEWENKENALQCESCHCQPVEILDYKYKFRSETPDCIEIRMSNGEIVKYYKR